MQPEANNVGVEKDACEACWSRIGIDGDRSCPKLFEAIHCRNCPVFSSAGQKLLEREATPDYLDEWTRRVAEVDATAAAETLSLLIFRIGDEWLAIDARCVIEVVEPHRIHGVPHRTDRLLLGLANIRGELQLCISLHELLGIDPSDGAVPRGAGCQPASTWMLGSASSAGPRERLLVAEQNQNRWAFPVDEVEGVQRIPTGAMKNLPHTVEKSPRFCSQAVFSHDDKRVGLLSEIRLFQALERTVR
ncbi:MAG: chemotaxis protein CheW [Planctomycetota bacterium]|nr:chemotaxis protein CheW [Planctomycetota bacterium]